MKESYNESVLTQEQINIIKEEYLKPLSENQIMGKRKNNEKPRERADGEWQRDFTRIIYASSFRRLQGKMQLLGIRNDQFFRNRLTHTLEVNQIAQTVSKALGLNMELTEAIALGHDLGHTPFGHHNP